MILNNITLKYLKLNKKRTIVTIIGIILSTALMVGIGLLTSSVREVAIKEISNYSGNYNMSIKNVDNNLSINHAKEIYYTSEIGFSKIDSDNTYKPYLCIYNVSNNFLDELKLNEGRYPENENEIVISDHISSNGGVNYNIGDTITLDYGTRSSNSLGNSNMDNDVEYTDDETLNILGSKTYTIVGIVARSPYESYSAPGYSVYTINSKVNNYKAYVIFDNPTNTYKYAKDIASTLNKKELATNNYEDIGFNDDLLYMYGGSKYDNFNKTMVSIMGTILGITAIGCIMVIYNSFAISVMERKKEFGILSSIGSTKKQIMLSVLYEALIVGTIGILLGILAAFLGIGIVISIIDSLLKNSLEVPLTLSAYPLYVIIPLIFMFIVVLISAFIPAIRASKITPIVAIRGNDDIKLSNKKVKENKLITKLFGIEASIAYKNMKRNKKKYRITIISLVVSFVLFVTFSSFSTMMTKSTDLLIGNVDYDLQYQYSDSSLGDGVNVIDSLQHLPDVDNYRLETGDLTLVLPVANLNATEEYKNTINKDTNYLYVNLIKLSDEDYNRLLTKYNLKDNTSLVINNFKSLSVSGNNKKVIAGSIFANNNPINVCYTTTYADNDYNCSIDTINNYYLVDSEFALDNISGINIIVSGQTFDKYIKMTNSSENDIITYNLFIKTTNVDGISKAYTNLKNNYKGTGNLYENNIAEQLKEVRNVLLVIKILVFGFIGLVTLIGVTSVLNTISTSIALRRREFAMLRSIGLTPKGLNKMVRFESLFFGLKALLFGIPISFGLMYLFRVNIGDTVSYNSALIPWSNLLIAVAGIFIIVFVSMWYSTLTIKKDNILEAIRDENI